MGGTIAEFKRWHWTVLCVTDCDERYNRQRRREFLKVCGIYNRRGSHIKASTLGIAKKKGRFSKVEITKRLGDFIEEFGPFDIVFTHDDRGDYGHKTHKLIHNIVKGLELSNLYVFITPHKESIWLKSQENIQSINLSPESHRTKRQALNVYLKGSQKTNLSKLKKLVFYALNTRAEHFISCN